MTTNPKSTSCRLLSITALITSCSSLALAQQSENTNVSTSSNEMEFEEIVVTATKSAQSIDDVPISITAYQQGRMDQLGIRTIEDISTLTPGLQIEAVRERASGSNISIRGISSRIGANTTGIYIDDAPIQVRIIGYDATNVYPLVFDLERIEVLRGPQGTLYGAGSMGGNVRFITPKPDLQDNHLYARGEIATTKGGDISYEAGAAIGVPLVQDKVAIRVSGWHRKDGGWVDKADYQTGDIVDENTNSNNTEVFRGAITFRPTEKLTITPSIFYQDSHAADASAYWSTLSDKDEGKYVNGYPKYQVYDDYFVMPSMEVEWDLGSVILTSSTSYFKRKAYNEWDYSTVVPAILSAGAFETLPGYEATSYFIDRQENITEELRLQSADQDARLTWVIGAYYGHREQDNFQSIDAVDYEFLLGAFGLPPTALGPLADAGEYGASSLLITNTTTDEQIAGFGEVNFKLTDALTITGGLRVERATLDFVNAQSGPFNGPLTGGVTEAKASPVTPKISLSYDIDEDNLVYATAAKGYRIGGGNAVLPATTCQAALEEIGIDAAPPSFEPDSLWSYEVGSKNSLLGGRLQVSSSAFYIEWQDIQQQVFPPCGFQYVENIGKLRSVGFDLQARARISEALTLGAQVGYVDAEYTEGAYPNNNEALKPLVNEGNSPLGVQPWNVVLTGDFLQPVSDDITFYSNITMIYNSQDKGLTSFLDPTTAVADPIRLNNEASTMVNARIGIEYGDFDVSLFAKNLLNSKARTSRNHDHLNSALLKETSLRPMTIGITATYRY